jgi:hypothetical protein
MTEFSPDTRRTALGLALVADALQIVLLPLFGEGALSPINDLLDIAVGWTLIRLLGWHWAFLPTFVAEMVPGIDLVPSWTLAVLIVTRQMSPAGSEPPVIEGRL